MYVFCQVISVFFYITFFLGTVHTYVPGNGISIISVSVFLIKRKG